MLTSTLRQAEVMEVSFAGAAHFDWDLSLIEPKCAACFC